MYKDGAESQSKPILSSKRVSVCDMLSNSESLDNIIAEQEVELGNNAQNYLKVFNENT